MNSSFRLSSLFGEEKGFRKGNYPKEINPLTPEGASVILVSSYLQEVILHSISGKKWILCPKQSIEKIDLLQELRISPLTAEILHVRGISDPNAVRHFISPTLSDLPDPFSMRDMDKAVGRIAQALRCGEKIVLYGDYDVDGTTATALLYLFLKNAGAQVDFFLPHRVRDGYGLNLEALRNIHSSGARLVITADCGISGREEVGWAAEKGLDVVVTDHHQAPDKLPPALAILNPKQKDCPYPFKDLAGVGVAFNLIIALRSRLRREGVFRDGGPNLKEYLDLVALGTVSDVVPLTGANRILVKFGLGELSRSRRPGIAALKEVAGMQDGPVDTIGINFRLAPRINAAGRLEDAREVVHLMTTRDPAQARQIAARLNDLNSLRQRIEEKILSEAREMVESGAAGRAVKSIVLSSEEWHPGVIGIVASRLTDQYHCPTILIALRDHLGKGSGRSIPRFSLYEGLKACADWVEGFGGHDQAAGLVIRPDRIPGFSRAFEETVGGMLREEDLVRCLQVEAITSLEQLNESFLAELESLGPFGMGNPEPILGLEDLSIRNSKPVGKGHHLRVRVQQGRCARDAIGFGWGSFHPLAAEGAKMAFSPQVAFFQGKRNLQLKILDLQL